MIAILTVMMMIHLPLLNRIRGRLWNGTNGFIMHRGSPGDGHQDHGFIVPSVFYQGDLL